MVHRGLVMMAHKGLVMVHSGLVMVYVLDFSIVHNGESWLIVVNDG